MVGDATNVERKGLRREGRLYKYKEEGTWAFLLTVKRGTSIVQFTPRSDGRFRERPASRERAPRHPRFGNTAVATVLKKTRRDEH